MSELLVDTSVIIDFLRRPDKAETRYYSLAAQGQQLAVSIITHTELYAGRSIWEHSRAKRELEVIFSGLTILSLEQRISEQAGHLKATHSINLLDAIIAATALQYKLPLSTLNVKDFKKIPELKFI